MARNGMVAASGILELSPADQVVTVATSILLDDLREALREVGQDLPLAQGNLSHWRLGSRHSEGITLREALDWNLPHTYEGSNGTWRDWILGGTMRTGTGLVGRSGARVVKSVAGFDVHRLLVGARGTLGELLEVHLRTVPLGATQEDPLMEGRLPAEEVSTILRVAPTQLDKVTDSIRYHLVDLQTATIWTNALPEEVPFAQAWLPNGEFVGDKTTASLMRRAKAIFDPEGKLPALEIRER
ncbi:FAD-binding oxidoreductase [bacterium]|nr:MAG: FAD-binding oxidoreductase [bacterium]